MAFTITRINDLIIQAQAQYNETGDCLNLAESYGVTVERVEGLAQDDPYWAAILVYHLTPEENEGKHNVYFDFLDGVGLRQNGLWVEWEYLWESGPGASPAFLCDKPLTEPAGNSPLFGGVVASFWMRHTFPSDIVRGIATTHPDETKRTAGLYMGLPLWEPETAAEYARLQRAGVANNTWGHHSFYIVWALKEWGESDPPDNGPTDPGEGDPIDPGTLIGTAHAGDHDRGIVIVLDEGFGVRRVSNDE